MRGEPKTSDFRKRIRQRQDEERKRLEKWKKEFKKMRDHNNSSVSLGSSTSQWSYTYSPNDISIRDDTTKATLIVDGRDVMKELDEMRDALLLLKRDVDMESKYPKLRELKDAYEAQLAKYKTWEALK